MNMFKRSKLYETQDRIVQQIHKELVLTVLTSNSSPTPEVVVSSRQHS